MPLFAKLASAADVRDRQDASVVLDEGQHSDADERVDRNVEAAVTLSVHFHVNIRGGRLFLNLISSPYCKAGAVPSRGVFLCRTTNMGTRVLSWLVYHTCSALKSSVFSPATFVVLYTLHLFSSSDSAKLYRAIVQGVVNPLSVAKNQSWSRRLETWIEPTKSEARRLSLFPRLSNR